MKQYRTMSGDPEFIGGLVPGTKVFLSNWKTVPIENIKVGDEVLVGVIHCSPAYLRQQVLAAALAVAGGRIF